MAFTSSDLLEHLDYNGIRREWVELYERGRNLFAIYCRQEVVGYIGTALQNHDDLSIRIEFDPYRTLILVNVHNHTN